MIIHVDMDAFFASVEQQDHPELRGKPVIIAGRSMRAVVSTASYEARAYGVRSAMPLFKAMRLCPQGIVVRGRMSRYAEVSRRIFSLIDRISPLVEQVSIDEAYIDITGCERLMGSPQAIALSIKKQIRDTVNLTCSIGIAPLKFIAKIASDMNKPDGITLIRPEEVNDFIDHLPIGKVPGVGVSTFSHLEALGIKNLGDIRRLDEKTLKAKLGVHGLRLKQLALGMDTSKVTPASERKSFSTETTLPEDTWDRGLLAHHLLGQADDVARLLRKNAVKARTITLKITFADFRQVTRRHTLQNPTQSAEIIYREALRLFQSENLRARIRLIGLGAAGLMPETHPVQALLFEDRETSRSEKWEKAERAMDSIVDKFGKQTVKRAIEGNSTEKQQP